MTVKIPSHCPGARAEPFEILALAAVYRAAATQLLEATPSTTIDFAPARLCALQAMELYLCAFLRSKGTTPTEIRSWMHDIAHHSESARRLGLNLRVRTVRHIHRIAQGREYVAVRYDPSMPLIAPTNRLQATLDELAVKVSRLMAPCLRDGSAAGKNPVPGGSATISLHARLALT